MSVLQTWFTRVIGTPRSKYGYTRCAGCGLTQAWFGIIASIPSVCIIRATRL